jgi:hypothetical protein
MKRMIPLRVLSFALLAAALAAPLVSAAPSAAPSATAVAAAGDGHGRLRAAVHLGGIGVHIGFGGHKHGGYEPRCAPRWVPGAWVTEVQPVWVPPSTERVWVPAVYETRYDSCGRPVQVLVKPGGYETVCRPGYYEDRRVRVWRPGYWA